jgi:addiction module HigA family antidote
VQLRKAGGPKKLQELTVSEFGLFGLLSAAAGFGVGSSVNYFILQGVFMAKLAVQSPGTVLKALMDEYQLNPTKLAEAIKLNQSTVRQISIGKTKISVPVALRFAKYFGNTAEYWLNLQIQYDLSEAVKDSELAEILKGIQKAKPVPAAKDEKKAAPAGKAGKQKAADKPEKAAAPKAPRKPRVKAQKE